ncbi:glycosyltransferase [Rheinheimera sp. A13L]|uniref:glycosyltransferase n=1 Tax=Rheinheimera sp. A13L TaxID=506534 RepID=UPI0002125304|nr:glycosyltransferase [Rheinheimera sp. A13L]EGM78114.1 glycosyltransferase [Rheinheimera sp. A13L]
MKILHIHQDFPDGSAYPHTKAVLNLIEAVEANTNITSYVLSLHRTSNPFRVSVKPFERGLSLVYFSLPLPYIHRFMLYFWASLIRIVYLNSMKFDLIHAHKLTSEGLFAKYLASAWGVKYLISVRGGTDFRFYSRMHDCKKLFDQILKAAKKVIFLTPAAQKNMEKLTSFPLENSTVIPNLCRFTMTSDSSGHAKKKNSSIEYTTVLSFHQYKRKGVLPLISAIGLLRDKFPALQIRLTIIGAGDDSVLNLIQSHSASLGLSDQIVFSGSLSHDAVLRTIAASDAMLLPALDETFGMAYLESIATQTPILYMKETGIDGFFRENLIGVSVTTQDPEEIARAILVLIEKGDEFRFHIAELIRSGFFNIFKSEHIVNSYTNALHG